MTRPLATTSVAVRIAIEIAARMTSRHVALQDMDHRDLDMTSPPVGHDGPRVRNVSALPKGPNITVIAFALAMVPLESARE